MNRWGIGWKNGWLKQYAYTKEIHTYEYSFSPSEFQSPALSKSKQSSSEKASLNLTIQHGAGVDNSTTFNKSSSVNHIIYWCVFVGRSLKFGNRTELTGSKLVTSMPFVEHEIGEISWIV